MRSTIITCAAAVLVAIPVAASAKPGRHKNFVTCNKQGCSDWWRPRPREAAFRHRHRRRRLATRHRIKFVPPGLEKVSTAADINVVVAPRFAPKIRGFIRALVARGYHPHTIRCWAPVGTHVRDSLHHTGQACDFDQSGWGRTVHFMHHVTTLARRFGLRDGCTFSHPRPDCGHIDAGRHFRHLAQN